MALLDAADEDDLTPAAREVAFDVAELVARALTSSADERGALLDKAHLLVKLLLPDDVPQESVSAGSESGGPTELETAVPSCVDVDDELVQEFIHESREYIGEAENALLALENDPTDAEAIGEVFRAFHTVKGVAAVLDLNAVATFAHRAESFLLPIRDRQRAFSPEYASLSLQAIDTMRLLVDHVAAGTDSSDVAGLPELLTRLEAAEGAQSLAPIPHEGEPLSPPGPMPGAASMPAPASSAPPPRRPASASAHNEETWLRVRTDRLDSLLDIVGELVIADSMVREDTSLQDQELAPLALKVSRAGKIVRGLQDLCLSLRMVPVKATFQKMTRVVRDTAKRAEKQAKLVTLGADTEVDRKLVDLLADPLVHMVRNAVDHGVEPADERVEAGKDPIGRIELRAFHSGGNVVIRLSDDGRGLDRAAIASKARRMGLIESDANMSDSEVYALIFEPGFSTSAVVTDVSGRGVGMDVVRRGIEELNGRVEISSTPGKGTTFTVHVPLTLAITDGMLVRVGAERYIIPTVNIQMSFQATADQYQTVAGRGELIVAREATLPLFRVSRLFSVHDAIEDPLQGLIVVVGDVERRTALLVDELLGKQQVVAKNLGEGIGKIPGISGGAILGDGRVGLILDPPSLTQLAHGSPLACAQKPRAPMLTRAQLPS